MGYADILIKVDGSKQGEETLEIAIELNRLFQAHLCAIYPLQPLSYLPYVGMAADALVVSQYMDNLVKEAETVHKKFKLVADKKLVSLEWRAPEGDVDTIMTEAGRLFDLVILSQGNTQEMQSLIRGMSEDVLLRLGRPSLVIPYIGCESVPFERILVAWDGGQAATRALNDALPFLRLAKEVEVTTVYEPRKNITNTTNSNENICEHLLRHGIGVKSTSLPHKEIDIANTLLNHVSDTGADLLVMGAYGHSRLREVVLGGVTRSLLQSMTVPLLMSH